MDRRTADDIDNYITNYNEEAWQENCQQVDDEYGNEPYKYTPGYGEEADPSPTGAIIGLMLAAFCGFCVGLVTAGTITILVLRAHHVL